MQTLYLVTGAAGHLGGTLLRELLSRGAAVRGLILPGEPQIFAGQVAYFEGDVTRPASMEAFFRIPADTQAVVIHAAGLISVEDGAFERLRRVNVDGCANVVEATLRISARFVYVSSVHAIPPAPHGITREISSFDPDAVEGDYAKTKAMATALVLDTCRTRGLRAVVVQPSGIIGPYDGGSNHIVQLLLSYLRGRLPFCVRGGYDFVDVRDVAVGCINAAERGHIGECYILCGRYCTLRDLLTAAGRVLHRARRVCYLPLSFVKGFLPAVRCVAKLRKTRPLFTRYALQTLKESASFTHSKATADFGYTTTPIEKTVADTARWLLGSGRAKPKAQN